MSFVEKLKNLSDRKTLILLETIAPMRAGLKKYNNKAECENFIRIFSDQNSRNEELKKILENSYFDKPEQRIILKVVHRWPWKKITIVSGVFLCMALIMSYITYLNVPRVYKLSKETRLYKDSRFMNPANRIVDSVDYFDWGGEFINIGENKIAPSGYFSWLFGMSDIYFQKDSVDFLNKKQMEKFKKVFSKLKEVTTDYDLLIQQDKIGVVKLIDSLGTNYSLSVYKNETIDQDDGNIYVLRNILSGYAVGLLNGGEAKTSRLVLVLLKDNQNNAIGYSVIINNEYKIELLSEFHNRSDTDDFKSIKWMTRTSVDDYLTDSSKKFIYDRYDFNAYEFQKYNSSN